MGFLKSNGIVCDGNITVFWTDIGREYLMGFKKPKDGAVPYYFSLADGDTNYLNQFEPQAGFIPDLTGNHNQCLLPTKDTIVRNQLTVENKLGKLIPLISNVRDCNISDCSEYFDMQPLDDTDSRVGQTLGDSIWDCIVGDFDGTL